MSRLISDILQAPEPHFSHTIKLWEQKSNQAGHDLRLLSEVSQTRKNILKSFNLDEADTTPREFYYSLRHKAAETNKLLEEKIGVKEDDTPAALAKKVIAFVGTLKLPKDLWVVKHSVVKKILKQNPPKKTLKALGLRSIDSVLKRGSGYEMLALAYQIESPDWKQKTYLQFKKLKPTDFQVKKAEIISIKPVQAEKLRKAGYTKLRSLAPVHEIGCVLFIPSKRRFELDTLALTVSLARLLRDLRVHSAFYRHISVKSDFGARFYNSLKSGLPGAVSDTQIGWKTLQKHFNSSPDAFKKIEQPYLQPDDILIIAPIDALAEAFPQIGFWKNSHSVFAGKPPEVASAHLMDVIVNSSNKVPYETGSTAYLRHSLWEDLGQRYLASGPIEAIVIEDIDRL